MRWMQQLRLRLRSLLRRSRVEDELGEELQYHLDHLVDDHVAAGMSVQEARYAARREMGAIEQKKEECRDARGVALADSIRQDVIYALRAYRRSPGFTAVAILSLALGIGANTTIFSVWNGLLHSPLPLVSNPDELVMLSDPNETGSWTGRADGPRSWLTYEEFEQLRDHADAFSSMMASQSSLERWRVRLGGSAWEEVRGRLVSGGFFQTLGAGPAIGRVFTTEEDHSDAPYAVLSYTYWQRRFGGRSDAVGQTLTLRNTAFTVIGVAARGFVGETSGQQPDLWIPLRTQPIVFPGVDRLHDTPPEKKMWLHVFARLKPGVTPAQAEAQANALFQTALESFYGAAAASPERRREVLDQRLQIRPGGRGASARRQEFSQSLTALLAGVGVLLLIACANLANLLLARGAARRPEIALRLSLGASRGRLIRQLVTESLALAVMGGAAALVVAEVLHEPLVRMLAQTDPTFRMTFTLDPTVSLFVAATTLGAALLFGILPAWRATRTDAGAALKDQSRGATASFGQQRSARLLVSVQLALSLPLLVGAGLLARTASNLQRADLGFPAGQVLLARVDFREAGYEGPRRDNAFVELAGAFRQIPGVRAVSFSELGVFSGGESSSTIEVEGYVRKTAADHESAMDVVGTAYFSTLGIPIVQGRDILESDRAGAPMVCVVNEAFTRQFFDKRNPIGMRITTPEADNATTYVVVGVARNARTRALRGEIEPRFFVAGKQALASVKSPTFLIRAAGETGPVMTAVRKTIQRADEALPIVLMSSVDERMAPLTAQDRTTARLAMVFGSVALALAAIGLYGVLSYGIARRTGEIAIRIALGAESTRVVGMILRETAGVVCAGLVLGGGLAYGVSRLIDSRLYGVGPQDPLTLGVATGLLLGVAFGAAYLPAQRAARVDPMSALRQ